MGKIDSTKNEAPATKAADKPAVEGAVSIRVDKDKYQTARTASGTKSLNNGDLVATTLEGMNLAEVQDLADKFIGENDFRKRYAKLNPGMQRMNIGNRLRGAVNKATVTDDKGVVTTDGGAKFTKAAGPITKVASARVKEAQKAADAKAKEAAANKAKAKDKSQDKAA